MSAQLAAAMKSVLRVLIVEDDVRFRRMLETMLRDLSCTPIAVASADEALEWLGANEADLIVLDLNMPRMDGLEFLRLLRERGVTTEVIILTGVGTLPAAQVAIRYDVSDFLTKPCHLGKMEAALDRVRRRLAMQRAPSEDRAIDPSGTPPISANGTLADLERRAILAALREHGGNRSAAAAALGISRRTMHYRLAEFRQSGVPLTFMQPGDDDPASNPPA